MAPTPCLSSSIGDGACPALAGLTVGAQLVRQTAPEPGGSLWVKTNEMRIPNRDRLGLPAGPIPGIDLRYSKKVASPGKVSSQDDR